MSAVIASQQSFFQVSSSLTCIVNKTDRSGDQGGCKGCQAAAADTVRLATSSNVASTYDASLHMQNRVGVDYDLLRAYVAGLLQEMGVATQVVTGAGSFDISELSQAEAQELVSTDGYFGVEQTSERIVDFAIAAAGGDPSQLAAVKEGIERGFQEAAAAFGGWLPDISYQTYDAIMEKLDSWASAGA
jgi:hypothetical protein